MGLRLAGEGTQVQVKSMRGAGRLETADGACAGGALLLLGGALHGQSPQGVPQQPKAHALQARHQLRVVVRGLAHLACCGRACNCSTSHLSKQHFLPVTQDMAFLQMKKLCIGIC